MTTPLSPVLYIFFSTRLSHLDCCSFIGLQKEEIQHEYFGLLKFEVRDVIYEIEGINMYMLSYQT